MNSPRPKVRLSRALGIPLTPKSVPYFERRPYPPGEHGRRRKATSEYKLRLLEKQRLRAQYNINETQLKNTFQRAARRQGRTGEVLLSELERRLDALVLRAGFARTIYQARQLVTHRHLAVNGRRADRPSQRLRPGDTITVASRSRTLQPFEAAKAGATTDAGSGTPGYLRVSGSDLTVELLRLPERQEIPVTCDEHLVVEFYSR